MQRARTSKAKEERRQALLAAALDEFYERGLAAARMDDIARRAGVSKGALYLYFDSKDALFVSLVEEYAAPNVALMASLAAEATDAKEALRRFIRVAPKVLKETPLPKIAKVVIADAPAFPEIVKIYYDRVVSRGIGFIERTLERAKKSGELNIDDPAMTARLFVAPFIFGVLWKAVFERHIDERLDLDDFLALHGDLLLRALACDGDGRAEEATCAGS